MNSFWRRSDFFLLGEDVDVPADELAGEAHVLAAAADGERELLVGHHDLDALGLLVEHDLGDIGRLQRRDHEVGDVVGPGDDVDLFALQFADHRLDARAAHTDAGADRIDRRIRRGHGDLGAAARVAGDRADGDDAVVDLRHFLHEQLGHELRMRAAQEDLRAALLAAHVVDVGADAVAVAVHLARDQLVAADDGFATAEVDDDVAVFDALDGAVDDLADAVDVLVVHALALGIAHLLHDHLLGRLGGDAAELDRRQRLGDEVAELGGVVLALGVLELDLAAGLLDGLDDLEQAPQAQLAGLAG